MSKFENIHRNKTLAFTDGLLCGVMFTLLGVMIHKDFLESIEVMEQLEDELN